MGKTRNLFKKIGNIKGTFHPKMDTMKDKNGRNLVDTEEIKKRWKEYMEELYKKDTNEPGYHNVVVSHPEPDILEYKVKWTLRSTAVNKASGCDEIPAELFRSLKNDAIKVLHLLCQQIWKTQQWPQDWKRSILIPIPKKSWSHSHVQFFEIPRTAACPTPLSMEFSRQEYWSGLPFLSLGDLPNLGTEPGSPALQADSLQTDPSGKQSPRRVMSKNVLTIDWTVALISHASKVMLKSYMLGFSIMRTKNFQVPWTGVANSQT